MAFLIWRLMEEEKSLNYIIKLCNKKPPAINLENSEEVSQYYDASQLKYGNDGGISDTHFFSTMPIPKLLITDTTFSANLFSIGFLYVSAKLRTVMNLPTDSVEYKDVDLSECAPAVQDIDYKVMNLLKSGDPCDYEKSSCLWVDELQADGTVKQVPRLIGGGPNEPPPKIVLLECFTAPAPLFMAKGIMATDELAERVLRAGITDVAFYDITNDGTQTDLRWKKLA
jgi:hypothetical protein